MKHIKLLLIVLLSTTPFCYGQYNVNFEDDTKGAYASGTVTLNGLDWNMTEALIGSQTNDFFNGTQSARLRGYGTSAISMLDDKTNGIGAISFDFRSFGTDTQVDWRVEYSSDSGTTWTQIGTDFVATSTIQTFNENVNVSGNIRVRVIRATTTGTTNRRMNIDDVSITDFTSTSIEFLSTTSTLVEDGLFVDICVAITNEDASNATTVEVALDAASTATNGTDYDDGAGTPAAIVFPQTLTFPAASSANQCVTIFISNDDVVFEPSETVILNLQNASGGNSAVLGTNAQHTLTITDNDPNPCLSIFSDDFSSGLTQWNNTTDWATTTGELQHNISGTGGISHIYSDIGVQNLSFGDYEWSFCMRNDNWDPTDDNNFSFVLLSSNSDLSSNATGYKVGINQASESDDLLKIYSVNNGVHSQIAALTSAFDWDNSDDICIRVTRNSIGDWELFYDDGTGEVSGVSGNDTTFTMGRFIGSVFEFTSTRAGELWVDDVNVCSIPISCSGTVTWDGSAWDNTTGPTVSDVAIIDGPYNTITSSFSACSLNVTATGVLTIAENTYVQITNDIDNAGRIIIADGGSLVQIQDTAVFTNSSAITTPVTVARRTAPVAANAWYEYTYWSSPVPEATLETLLPNTSGSRKFRFNASLFLDNEQEQPGNTGVFITNQQDDIDDDGNAWSTVSGVMAPGTGYAATLGPNDLLGPGGGSTGIVKNFEGNTLNTGPITVAVDRNDGTTSDNNWNLIGNPYPSAIDANLFLAENIQDGSNTNAVLAGSIYLWSHSTAPSATTVGNEPLNFDVNDYAIINTSANIAGEDGLTPNNTIGAGQGFFVLYSDATPTTSGSAYFSNSMRITGDNEQFYRTTTNNQDNKLWLNLTSDNGIFSQIAIAYVDGATNSDDGPTYDARRFYSGASAMLVSHAENSNVPLAIQGKHVNALDYNEVIPLGIKTGITSPTIYTISIDHLQGDFLSNNAIYLKDNLSNTYQDLTLGDYSFTSEMGEFNDRFEVVFTQPSLGINDQILSSDNLSIIETNNDNVIFKLSSTSLTIKTIKIYDALGRLVYNLKGAGNTETYNLSNLSQAAFVAQIELSNGQVINKKGIKK